MIKTTFDPTMLFISAEAWKFENKRDVFLEHLINNLEMIKMLGNIRIYWSDELESHLWNHPHLPQWRCDPIWRNSFIPIIYKTFPQYREFLQCTLKMPCKVIPNMVCESQEILNSFLILMHQILYNREDIILSLGLDNQAKNDSKYRFESDKTDFVLTPKLINSHNDWLSFIEIENIFWPKHNKDFENLRKGIELVKQREFPDRNFKYR